MSNAKQTTLELPDDITPQELARLSVERFITTGSVIEAPRQGGGVFARRAGTFVTLRKASDGELRGCIGRPAV
jgi:AMMECR1 domain-containing protein